MCGPVFAQRLQELIAKSLLLANEPVQWKGGMLAVLYKGKGPMADSGSHRAIWLASVLAKLYHRWLVLQLQPFTDKKKGKAINDTLNWL